MTDFFAVLALERRPWLEPDVIKEAFHRQSLTVHPDRVHEADEVTRRAAEERYATLNAAQQCLREPKERLLHLVQLERGRKPGDMRSLPEGLMRLFGEVNGALRASEKVLLQRQSASSALLRAQTLQAALPLLEQMESLQSQLQAQRTALLTEVQIADATWGTASPTDREVALDGIEGLYHQFGFVDRWLGQLRERTVQLTL
jgi:curved DNA-binding protein CbpA